MSARPSGLLVACVLLAAGASACSDDPGTAGAPSQRVVYRVEDLSQGVRVTTVVVDTAPPYLGRTVTLEGPPPGGASLGGAAWDADTQLLLRASGEAAVVQQVATGTAGVVQHLDVALASAARHGLARRTGSSTVAGHACERWLTKEPLDAGPFAPASASDRTESCVDGQGRLLQDRWTLRGKAVRVRTAVTIGAGPSLDGDGLLQGRSPSPADAKGLREQVRSVPAERLADAFAIPVPAAPPGFVLEASTAFVTLAESGEHRTEGMVLTFRSGPRLAVLRLEQGLGFRLPPATDGVVVTVGGRTARLQPQVNGLRLQLTPRPGRSVSVVSSLDEDALLAWGATLRLGP